MLKESERNGESVREIVKLYRTLPVEVTRSTDGRMVELMSAGMSELAEAVGEILHAMKNEATPKRSRKFAEFLNSIKFATSGRPDDTFSILYPPACILDSSETLPEYPKGYYIHLRATRATIAEYCKTVAPILPVLDRLEKDTIVVNTIVNYTGAPASKRGGRSKGAKTAISLDIESLFD